MKTIQVLVDVVVGDSNESESIIMGVMEAASGKFPNFRVDCLVVNAGEHDPLTEADLPKMSKRGKLH